MGERVPDAFTEAHCASMIARETASRTATVELDRPDRLSWATMATQAVRGGEVGAW